MFLANVVGPSESVSMLIKICKVEKPVKNNTLVARKKVSVDNVFSSLLSLEKYQTGDV